MGVPDSISGDRSLGRAAAARQDQRYLFVGDIYDAVPLRNDGVRFCTILIACYDRVSFAIAQIKHYLKTAVGDSLAKYLQMPLCIRTILVSADGHPLQRWQ